MNPSTSTYTSSPQAKQKRRPNTAKPSSSTQLYSNMLSGNDYRTNTSGEYTGEDQYINQSMSYEIKPKRKERNNNNTKPKTKSKPKLQLMIEELKKTQEKEKEMEIQKLSNWLKQYHLLDYLDSLIEIGYDNIDCLNNITVTDLQYINMKIGHQRLLFKALGKNMNKIQINNNTIIQKENKNKSVCVEESSVIIDSFDSEFNKKKNNIGKYEVREDKMEDSQLLVIPSSPITSPHKRENKNEIIKEEEVFNHEKEDYKGEEEEENEANSKGEEEEGEGDFEKEDFEREEKKDNKNGEGESEDAYEEIILKPKVQHSSTQPQYKVETMSEQRSASTCNYQVSYTLKDIPIEISNINNNNLSEPEYYKYLPDLLNDFNEDRIYEENEAKSISIELLNNIEKLHLLCKNITFSTSCYLNGITVKEFLSIQNNINNESIESLNNDEFKQVELKHFYNRKLFLLQLVIKSLHNAYNVIEEKYMRELENNNEMSIKISQIYNEEKIRKMKYRELDNKIEEYKHRRNIIWEKRLKDYQKREIRRSQIYSKYLEGKIAAQHTKSKVNYEKLERRKRIDKETEKRGEIERKKLAEKLKEKQEKADAILQAKSSIYIQNGEENEKRRREAYLKANEIYLNKIKKRADYILRKEEEYNSRIMTYSMNEKLKNYEKKLYEDDKIQEVYLYF